VQHRGGGCFGFLFQEKTRRPFLPEKAEALGVPFGPERARLVRGEAVTLKDGRIIQPDEVLGEPIVGTKYVHIGDVGETADLHGVVAGADVLVIESTYTSAETDMARRFGHLTAVQAATLARDAGVHTLILTHLSRRHTAREIYAEARPIFPQTYVARDFDHFQISRQQVVRLPLATEATLS
jgi:ribonuclease Z